MRKLLMVLILVLVCGKAWSANIPYQIIGHAYNDGWWYQAGSQYIGPANRGGTAVGFVFGQNYHVATLTGFISGIGSYPGFKESVIVSLYRGSVNFRDTQIPIPSNELIWESERRELDFTFDKYATVNVENNLGMNLEAGEYWLSYRGGTALGSLRSEGFTLEGEEIAGVHAPEPATMLLMGGGLLAMLRRKKSIREHVVL